MDNVDWDQTVLRSASSRRTSSLTLTSHWRALRPSKPPPNKNNNKANLPNESWGGLSSFG